MKIFEQIKGKSLLFLITGILILCAGFIIEGCGDPELKTTDSKKGQCAIDFTLVPGTSGAVFAGNDSFPSIAGNELTIEAWIKPKPTSTPASPGGIFGRIDLRGVNLGINNNIPRFTLRVMTVPTSTPGIDPFYDYTVNGVTGLTELTENEWAHVAGVLVDDDHTNTSGDGDVHGACMDELGNPVAGGLDERPHLDLYVNGHFVNCATVYGGKAPAGPDPASAAQADQRVSDPLVFGMEADSNYATIGQTYTDALFEGVIDEVRLWTVARTSTQLNACVGRELSTSGGEECGINTNILKGYWRFNECEHADVLDWSGAGSKGTLEVGGEHWEDGWVEGVRVNGALLPMD